MEKWKKWDSFDRFFWLRSVSLFVVESIGQSKEGKEEDSIDK